jgi:hypothetical protein
MPQVCAKTFSIGIVLLKLLQAVRDLETPNSEKLASRRDCAPP